MDKSDKKRNVAHLINLLLEEPKIAEVVKSSLKKEARNYNACKVDLEVWDALVDMTVGTAAHTPVLEGLSRETILRGIRKKEYDWICDRFFDVCRHLTNDGYWKTIGTKTDLNEAASHHFNGCPYSGGVKIEVEPAVGPTQRLHVVDILGDVFEVISARWVGGRKC